MGTEESVKMSDRAGKQRAVFAELVESISRKAQKQGQSRLRSFLASLGTVPVFGLGLGFSPAPLIRTTSGTRNGVTIVQGTTERIPKE